MDEAGMTLDEVNIQETVNMNYNQHSVGQFSGNFNFHEPLNLFKRIRCFVI